MGKQILVLLALCLGVFSATAQTGEVTITGEVVDLVSYMASGVKPNTPQGLEIFQASAKGGNPLGVLEEGSDRLYVVTQKQANAGAGSVLLPWAGSKIVAKGKVYTKGAAAVLVLTTIGKAAK